MADLGNDCVAHNFTLLYRPDRNKPQTRAFEAACQRTGLAGARLFEQITANNVKKRLAIILDNNVYSAPSIQEKISGGNAQITGTFSMQEAKDLATQCIRVVRLCRGREPTMADLYRLADEDELLDIGDPHAGSEEELPARPGRGAAVAPGVSTGLKRRPRSIDS